MTTQSDQQLIMQGIHGLPSETLAEEEERETILLRNDLKQLSLASVAHLEKEFAEYEESLWPLNPDRKI